VTIEIEAPVSGSTNEAESPVDPAFLERLRYAADKVGSANALAKRAGISQSGFHRYLNGGEPTRKMLSAIANAAAVSVEWLAFGIGEPEGKLVTVGPMDHKVPILTQALALGAGSFLDRATVTDYMTLPEDYMRRVLGVQSVDGVVAFPARGDSMSPTMLDGDLALVDLSLTDKNDGVYAFAMDNLAHVKRLIWMHNAVRVVSDNHALYPPYEIKGRDMNSLAIIGRVCGYMRKG
jgi:phage repressor protein C with HTH and peptisase S24 domain